MTDIVCRRNGYFSFLYSNYNNYYQSDLNDSTYLCIILCAHSLLLCSATFISCGLIHLTITYNHLHCR